MSIRTSCPKNDNKYYLKSPTGYNKCILGNKANKENPRPTAKSCLPNCVGYAYGRYLEYWKLEKAPLPTCNAKDWDNVAKTTKGITYKKTPEVGAVIVFEGTTYGHVAFVEEIKSNGDLLLSESNWSHAIFRNVTVKKANNYAYPSGGLKCVGFICNPNAPKAKPKEESKPKAKYTVGEYVVDTTLLNVRTGPSKSHRVKLFTEFTENAQREIRKLIGRATNGYVKGLHFTALEISGDWGRTPSGWVCLDYCKRV